MKSIFKTWFLGQIFIISFSLTKTRYDKAKPGISIYFQWDSLWTPCDGPPSGDNFHRRHAWYLTFWSQESVSSCSCQSGVSAISYKTQQTTGLD